MLIEYLYVWHGNWTQIPYLVVALLANHYFQQSLLNFNLVTKNHQATLNSAQRKLVAMTIESGATKAQN